MVSQSKNTDVTKSFSGSAADQPAPDDDQPMTEEQAALLKHLCEQAHEPQAFDGELTKAEAREFIKVMRRRTSLPQ